MRDFVAARNEMVKRQIIARRVRDPLVLGAMRIVPRESFVLPAQADLAYGDTPLPIGADQTISQPYMVAYMIESLGLKGGEKVLEVGTGSGYAAAVLSQIADEVYTVERIAVLAEKAVATISSLRYHNVQLRLGDGTIGWTEHAPYDAIIVSAGAPSVPETLKSQLKIGGRMVVPVGSNSSQQLIRIQRNSETDFTTQAVADVRFVPLIGSEGWESATG